MTDFNTLADLPKRCCGRCVNWTRQQPADLTAPEGKCGLPKDAGHWPTGYWPHTLMRDGCYSGFKRTPRSQ